MPPPPLYYLLSQRCGGIDDGRNSGLSPTQEVIDEAVDFVRRWRVFYKEFTDEGDWFLNRGIKDVVTDPQNR